MTEKAWTQVTTESCLSLSENNGFCCLQTVTFPVLFLFFELNYYNYNYTCGRKKDNSEATQESVEYLFVYMYLFIYLFIYFTTYKKNTRKERRKTNTVHIYARLKIEKQKKKQKQRK